ncbi:hypothetical protein M407DRAFT_73040, partial [Tulasnella calospora MUT 4182]
LFSATFQDLLGFLFEFLGSFGEDQDIHVVEDVIHEVLENGWRVGEAERHDLVLVMPEARSEGGFPFVAFFDAHKVVAGPQV